MQKCVHLRYFCTYRFGGVIILWYFGVRHLVTEYGINLMESNKIQLYQPASGITLL